MNEVQCTIPADTLQFTVSALTELAIMLSMEADRLAAIGGEVADQASAELREREEGIKKTADFYFELYKQRPAEWAAKEDA